MQALSVKHRITGQLGIVVPKNATKGKKPGTIGGDSTRALVVWDGTSQPTEVLSDDLLQRTDDGEWWDPSA